MLNIESVNSVHDSPGRLLKWGFLSEHTLSKAADQWRTRKWRTRIMHLWNSLLFEREDGRHHGSAFVLTIGADFEWNLLTCIEAHCHSFSPKCTKIKK